MRQPILKTRTFAVACSIFLSAALWCISTGRAEAASVWNNSVSPVSLNLRSVWGSSSSSIYAAGDGIMLYYNGSAWAVINNLCANFQAVSGTDASHVVAVGSGGPLDRYDTGRGSLQWYANPSWASGDESALWPSGTDNYVAVGASAAVASNTPSTPITRMTSGQWIQTPSSNTLIDSGWTYQTKLNAVWGSSANNVWAAGRGEGSNTASFYHSTGSGNWITDSSLSGEAPVQAMWGSSANDIWAAGGDGSRREIYHYNGTSWSVFASYTSGALAQMPHAIWGSASNDIWLAGDQAAGSSIEHFNGTSWSAVAGPPQNATADIYGLWGNSANNVWAVGAGGNIFHYGTGNQPSGNLTGSSTCGSTNPQLTVSVSPTTTVDPGGIVQVNWHSANALTLTINGQPMSSPTSGSNQYWVTGNTTFHVQACNASNTCTDSYTPVTMVPSLNVALTVTPQATTLPASAATMQATVTGTATGNITYTFYCDRSDAGTNILPNYSQQIANSTQTTVTSTSCPYNSAGVFKAKVIVQRGSAPATEARVTVTRANQIIAVSLASNPTSGPAPFSPTLTATLGGAAQGPITYTFYCNRNDTLTTITPGWNDQFLNQPSTNTVMASTACNYTSAGTYYAKVIAQQGTAADVQAVIPIVVGTQSGGLAVSLSSPSNNTAAPINGAVLIARPRNNGTAPITYYFWCNKNLNNASIPSDYDYTTTTTSTTVSTPALCNYPSVGTAVTRVVIQQGSSVAYTLTSLAAISPNLSVTMSVASGAGTVPLINPTMNATVAGSATGNITYTFYCNQSDTSTNVLVPYDNQLVSGSSTATFNQCSYTTVGRYYAKVVVQRGTYSAEYQAVLNLSQPTLTATLTVPPSATTPANSVSFQAAVGGSTTGTINYYFYCNLSDPTTIPQPNSSETFMAQTLTSMTSTACNYTTAGTYTAKVIVQRGALAAQAQAIIVVSDPIPQPPQITSFTVDNAIVNLGQKVNFSWQTTDATSVSDASPNWTPTTTSANCSVNCGSVVMTTLGNNTFWIQVVGPLGTAEQQITVGVVKPTSASGGAASYNYGKGINP